MSLVLAVGFHRAGSKRGVPHVWLSRIGGHRSAVVPIKPLLGLSPGGTRIPADGDTCPRPATFVDPLALRGMEGERMAS